MEQEEQEIQKEVELIEVELRRIERDIAILEAKKRELKDKKEKLQNKRISIRQAQLTCSVLWEQENYEWSTKVRKILKEKFKLKDFRAQQLRTINAILSGHNVMLLAPTGGGKSLCYQLPALVTSGLTVVISPLISLMEDQAWAMDRLGIETKVLSSNSTPEMTSTIYKMMSDTSNVASMRLKLLYVTPERLAKSKRFMNTLQKAYKLKKIDRFAIDEVHCCSQWGHDFRPDYKFLGILKTLFPDIPILGVTATATAKVIADVQKMLNIQDSLVFNAPFNRPNLYYHVMAKPTEKDKMNNTLAELMSTRYKGQSGIIYTYSIKDSEEVSAELLKRDIKVRPYHANLDNETRTRIHSRWLKGEIQAVVATVAFGMGIDKPNVRFVIHHSMSKSMENFYQESGRAGRDGLPAECLLFYRLNDVFRVSTMMFSEHTGLRNTYHMVEYCITSHKCRRNIIAKHFAEVWNDTQCGRMCDFCFNKFRPKPPPLNIAKDCKALRRIIKRANELQMNLTALKLVESWYGKGPSQLRIESPPKYSKFIAEQIIAHLLINDFLKEEFSFTAYATHSYIKVGPAVIPENVGIPFIGYSQYELPDHLPKIEDDTRKVEKEEENAVKPEESIEIPDESSSSSSSEDEEEKEESTKENGSQPSRKRVKIESESESPGSSDEELEAKIKDVERKHKKEKYRRRMSEVTAKSIHQETINID